jgi:endonuclease-3
MENLDQRNKRASKIIDILSLEYPEAKCHLDFENPFQLLISTILAAQCRDDLVNHVMGEMYKKYKGPADFANADLETLERDLSLINFFRNKAKNVQACCKTLIEKFNGEVPRTMEELVSLAGVGRKTANCVLGNCFGFPAIIMDTHVIRVSQRLGLTPNSNPDKIELDLKKIIHPDKQTSYSLKIGEHGRQVCHAKKPKCGECAIGNYCPSKGKV